MFHKLVDLRMWVAVQRCLTAQVCFPCYDEPATPMEFVCPISLMHIGLQAARVHTSMWTISAALIPGWRHRRGNGMILRICRAPC
jgi:hypothetical protein